MFNGKERLVWSLNNYLGLANHPEVREADTDGAKRFGMAAPMGARMMSGQTKYHEQLERELAEFVGKPDAFLLNFGYQGMLSIIDCLLTHRDVVVYDAEAHACIIDGLRMHNGKRFVYGHNDMDSLRLQLKHATDLAEQQNGGVLVITEGVFGISVRTDKFVHGSLVFPQFAREGVVDSLVRTIYPILDCGFIFHCVFQGGPAGRRYVEVVARGEPQRRCRREYVFYISHSFHIIFSV